MFWLTQRPPGSKSDLFGKVNFKNQAQSERQVTLFLLPHGFIRTFFIASDRNQTPTNLTCFFKQDVLTLEIKIRVFRQGWVQRFKKPH